MSILTRGAVDLYALFEWGLTIFTVKREEYRDRSLTKQIKPAPMN
jgi:hypothetical protein